MQEPATLAHHRGGGIDGMLAEKHSDPLGVLAEVKYYHSVKLATDEKWQEACIKLLGEESGKTVATGGPDQVMSALAKYVPEKAPKSLTGAAAEKKAEGGGAVGGLINRIFGK